MKRGTEEHKAEIAKMKEKLEDINENFELEKAKRIASDEKDKLQKKC